MTPTADTMNHEPIARASTYPTATTPSTDEFFRLVAEATRDIVWEWEVLPNTVHYADRIAVLGHSPAALSSPEAAVAMMHPDDIPVVERLMGEILEGKRDRIELEYRFRRADGTYAPILDRAIVQRDAAGKPIRVIGAMTDLSALRAAERARAEAERKGAVAEELARFKTTFMNMAAHELATPLTPLKLQVHLLKGQLGAAIPRGLQSSLQMLERNVNRLHDVVHDLLEVGRVSDGRFPFHVEPVNVSDLLRETLATFAEPIAAKHIVLETDFPDELVVSGDPGRLSQIITNLVANAVNYNVDAGRIKISAEKDPAGVTVTVQDWGRGLASDELENLFQPFRRFQSSHGTAGTGLGLFICKGFVNMHQGRISATSAGPNLGTNFTFWLPRVLSLKGGTGPPATSALGAVAPVAA